MAENPESEREGRGRTEKKKAAQAVEALAVRMVASSEAVCKSLPLTEKIRNDLEQARNITSRTAKKRQLKHLAGLLRRDEDSAAAIGKALDAIGKSSRAERDAFRRIEGLRDDLCDPKRFAEAIDQLETELPGLDRKRFARLARRFHETGDKSASREIFRRLRALVENSSAD